VKVNKAIVIYFNKKEALGLDPSSNYEGQKEEIFFVPTQYGQFALHIAESKPNNNIPK